MATSSVIGPFSDYEGNPILSPTTGFEAKAVYNPAIIIVDGIFWMLYRAEAGDEYTGRIGLAKSEDGIHFSRHSGPVIVPEYEYEAGGCEDPRLVRIGDTFYLTYVGCPGKGEGCHICLATSKDLVRWKKHGPILRPAHAWDSRQAKAGSILPQKMKGKFMMYFTGEAKPWETAIGIAYSDDLLHWYEPLEEPVLLPRKGYFDSKGVEPGPPPVLLEEGILLVYNGWSEDHTYKPGWALFSREQPEKMLARSDEPILEPEVNWGERFGVTNHVVAESLLWHKGRWWLYYGAADKVVCLATEDTER
jgi:predicted GH43/DUF377 family glycosyl hydrolase